MMRIEVLYFTDTGHTAQLANAIAEGAGANLRQIGADGTLAGAAWHALDAADAIVFGTPTYMGGPAWPFKRVADESGQRWLDRTWSGKLAGGFTCAGSPNGDKGAVMLYLATLAAQHGMLWVSLDQLPAQDSTMGPMDMNWNGGSFGPTGTVPNGGSIAQGDILSARAYGERIAAEVARRS